MQYLTKENWNRSQDKIEKLISEDRVNYVVPGNYESGTHLDITVRGVLKQNKRKHLTN